MDMGVPSPEQIGRFSAAMRRLAGDAPGRVGIAVSGGPDSLALLLLAEAARPGDVAAATVDHGLRPESAREAAEVARICAERGLAHRILPARPAAGASVQAHAREARYEALRHWSEEEGVAVLLTAHHADDQAETLLMRLMRGSGLAGLAGIRARRREGPLLVCRPLLGWRRAELAEIVARSGIAAADDPSNRDDAYDRARLRKRLAEMNWLDVEAIARSAAALAESEKAVEWIVDRLEGERMSREGGAILLDPANLPRELQRRLVLRSLRIVDPQAAPRGGQLGALIDLLLAGGASTIGSVKCTGERVFRFEAAPPRRR